MGISRLISIFLLAIGLYLLGEDASGMVNGMAGPPQPLDAVWRALNSASYYAAENFIVHHMTPDVWDSGVAVLLKLPAWTLPLGFGFGLLAFDIFTQGRSRKGGKASEH